MRACLGIPGKPCAKPISSGSRCPTCKREFQRQRKAQGRTGERGSTHASRERRQRVLERAGHTCFYCGEPATIADHFVPLVKGGADTEENLVAACVSCNQRKADKMPRDFLREIRGARRAGHLIILVGPPGSGKTTVAQLLANRLQQPFASVDDFGATGQRRWKELLRWLSDRPDAIVEANVIQPPFARMLGAVEHTVVRLDASKATRAERLVRRGDSPPRQRRMLEHRPAVYTYPADRTIDTAERTPDQVALLASEWLAERRRNAA